jgi:hypothetical protein
MIESNSNGVHPCTIYFKQTGFFQLADSRRVFPMLLSTTRRRVATVLLEQMCAVGAECLLKREDFESYHAKI